MVALSRLFVDKITLTFPVLSKERQDDIKERLCNCAGNGDIDLVLHGDLLQRYMEAYTVPLGRRQSIVIQVAPRDERMNFMRVEFNPTRRTPEQEHPFIVLMSIISPVWPAFLDSLPHARVSRVDFAIDIYGVHIDCLGIHHNKRATYSRYFARDGHTAGFYLGERASNRGVLLYDKKRQEKNYHRRYYRQERTRVECRLKDSGTFAGLFNIPNPFDLFSLTLYPPDGHLSHEYLHFLDSCRCRGAQAALFLIKDRRKRAAYRTWLNENCRPSWWRPDAIWNQRMAAIEGILGVSSQ